MNKLEQIELSKKLYDELSDKGLVKKHGDIGFLIWKIAFGTACEYFLQTKENEPKKQCGIKGVSNQRELLFAEKGDYVTYIGGGRGKHLKLGKKYEVRKDCKGKFITVNNEIGRRQIYNTSFFSN